MPVQAGGGLNAVKRPHNDFRSLFLRTGLQFTLRYQRHMTQPNSARSETPRKDLGAPGAFPTLLVLIGIVLIGTYLRASTLGFQPLWLDEVATLSLAQVPLSEWLSGYVDPSPPLYYFTHQIILGDATDPATIRSLSLVFGILTIPVVCILGREAHSPFVGLVAAAIIAVGDVFIEYSQEARTYALVSLCIAIALVFTIKALRSAHTVHFVRPLLLANVAYLAAAYSHLSTLPLIAMAQLAILWAVWGTAEGRAARMKRFAVISFATCFAAIPLIAFIALAFENGAAGWIAKPDLYILRRTYHQLLMVRGFSDLPAWETMPVYLLAAYGAVCALRLEKSARLTVLGLAIFPIVLFAVSQIRPVLLTRSALPAGMGLAILIALALYRVPTPWRALPTVAVLAAFTVSSVTFAKNPITHDDYTPTAVAILGEHAEPSDLVLFTPLFIGGPIAYHLRDGVQPTLVSWEGDKATTYPHQVNGRPTWLTHAPGFRRVTREKAQVIENTDRFWAIEGFRFRHISEDPAISSAFDRTVYFDKLGERIILFERRKPGFLPTQ